MDDITYAALANARIERAKQYVDADSHNGCLRQFNVHFVKEGIGGFGSGDYKRVADAQRIRNNSDYDDFYVADKEECTKQVETARYFFERSKEYLDGTSMFMIQDRKNHEMKESNRQSKS